MVPTSALHGEKVLLDQPLTRSWESRQASPEGPQTTGVEVTPLNPTKPGSMRQALPGSRVPCGSDCHQ